MSIFKPALVTSSLSALLLVSLAGCESGPSQVSYSKDVRPILEEVCMECHKKGGKGEQESGFSMESYADIMKGTKFGPMIVASDAYGSNLVVLIEGRADKSLHMPRSDHGPLSLEEVDTIKHWIDQGALDN